MNKNYQQYFNQDLAQQLRSNTVAKTISICKGVDAMKVEGYDTYRIK